MWDPLYRMNLFASHEWHENDISIFGTQLNRNSFTLPFQPYCWLFITGLRFLSGKLVELSTILGKEPFQSNRRYFVLWYPSLLRCVCKSANDKSCAPRVSEAACSGLITYNFLLEMMGSRIATFWIEVTSDLIITIDSWKLTHLPKKNFPLWSSIAQMRATRSSGRYSSISGRRDKGKCWKFLGAPPSHCWF